jgi:predicted RNA-binding protein with PUA-like domain
MSKPVLQHWLFKSEPDTFGWEHLTRDGRTEWSGVRNFQARNLMKSMHVGDLGLFYHSSTKIPGAVGIVRVTREAYPDFTARDPKSDYYDPKATEANPIWEMVDVVPVRAFKRLVSLTEMRGMHELDGMLLLRRGSRLSVQPVTIDQFEAIVARSEEPEP